MKTIWSKQALNDLESLTDYLTLHWGEKVTKDYLSRIESLVGKIADSPMLFPETKFRKGVRRAVISKHNTIYYNATAEHIEIITIFDTRQNEDKIKL